VEDDSEGPAEASRDVRSIRVGVDAILWIKLISLGSRVRVKEFSGLVRPGISGN
jgi:hypothetical protein